MNFLGHASNSRRPDRDVALISGASQNFAFPVEITAVVMRELCRCVMKVRREGLGSSAETKEKWRSSYFPTEKPGSISTV